MERNYDKCILLIESNEKTRSRGIRIGAFQVNNSSLHEIDRKQTFEGELSKRSREARSLLAMLIRDHPKLHFIWSVSPAHSAEFFEELKVLHFICIVD